MSVVSDEGVSHHHRPGPGTYLGLFLVSLATLSLEILLTRIFSVTMWYHYAFLAISVAMFGMTAGALIVYLAPGRFPREGARSQMGWAALAFSGSVVGAVVGHLLLPFLTWGPGWAALGVGLTYLLAAAPFTFSGICICLALTRFPAQVSKLYAADLLGAGAGCLALVGLLKLMDGPSATFALAALGAMAGALFGREGGERTLARAAAVAGAGLLAMGAGNAALARTQQAVVRVVWAKGKPEPRGLYERWNSFSRIKVVGDPYRPEPPFGWGLSPAYRPGRRFYHVHLNIDATAGTVITRFDGDLSKIEDLGYDVTNVAHFLRRRADVLAVGSGGGRDVLAALQFGQRSVVGVELNEDINRALNLVFGSYSGHLDRRPGVRFVADEARSYAARSKARYDIIQVSLIDTWAATAAGAFVLAENSLYTTEAWETFLRRLKPGGILSVSRWYFRQRPAEVYRLVALARTSLLRLGVRDPRAHIAVIRCMPRRARPGTPDGVGTVLVSPDPLTGQDLRILERVAREKQFELMLTPEGAADPNLAALASRDQYAGFVASYPLNVAAPTDDSPFFFHTLRLRDALRRDLWEQGWMSFNARAVVILGVLLLITLVLTALCAVVPVRLTLTPEEVRRHGPLLAYFSLIGLGFMFVEISQMQRLIIFLGHPTYGLSVVLFSLLIASGLGSLSTARLDLSGAGRGATRRLALLAAALVLFGLLSPHLIIAWRGASTPARITLSALVLGPPGFLMGMAFPVGMKLAAREAQKLTPCLWGINGASSVCASVLAVALAMNAGITSAFWAGVGCYLAAMGAVAGRSRTASTSVPSRKMVDTVAGLWYKGGDVHGH